MAGKVTSEMIQVVLVMPVARNLMVAAIASAVVALAQVASTLAVAVLEADAKQIYKFSLII